MSRDHLKSHVGFYKSRYRGYILYESEGIIYLDRITINEGLRFNVKKSHDFLSGHMALNLYYHVWLYGLDLILTLSYKIASSHTICYIYKT